MMVEMKLEKNRPAPGGTGREGFAMVTTLLMVLVLGAIAVGVVWMAASEKKTSFAEQVHMSSVFAADAGTEAGINFVRVSDGPPQIADFNTNAVTTVGQTSLVGSQNYQYDCLFEGRRLKPGWGLDYKDFDYRIRSQGQSSQKGLSDVEVVVSRLFKEGYN